MVLRAIGHFVLPWSNLGRAAAGLLIVLDLRWAAGAALPSYCCKLRQVRSQHCPTRNCKVRLNFTHSRRFDQVVEILERRTQWSKSQPAVCSNAVTARAPPVQQCSTGSRKNRRRRTNVRKRKLVQPVEKKGK